MSKEFAVVKFGSELVANGNGVIQDALDGYAAGLAGAYRDTNLIVITSGAILTGYALAEAWGRDMREFEDVTSAQLGGNIVMTGWCDAFARVNVLAGSSFITHRELSDTSEGPYFKHTLELAGRRGIVSVVNANDAAGGEETNKDNDELAVRIARAVGASSLTLFTGKGGIVDDTGSLIKEINAATVDAVRVMLVRRAEAHRAAAADKSKNGRGRGGIESKFKAAWEAACAGIPARIAAVNKDMTGAEVTEFVVG